MTTTTLTLARPTAEQFLAIFNRLCVALREPQDDSGVTQGVYFDALQDLAVTALEGGAVALMKESGRRFFPTTAEWRTASEAVQQRELREMLQPDPQRGWMVECDACDDTGWERYDCAGDAFCGRTKPHAAHPFVKPCLCRPTNRTWARHQQFGGGA